MLARRLRSATRWLAYRYGESGPVVALGVWYFFTSRRRLERERAAQALTEAHDRYRQIVETTSEGVWTLDEHLFTTFVNGTMARMLGYQPDEMLGKPLKDFIEPDGGELAEHALAVLRNDAGERLELPLRGRDGREVWTLVSSDRLYGSPGEPVGTLVMVTDVTERKRMQVRLAHLADHDPLTGVYSRPRLIAELDRELRYAARANRPGAVLVLDLDNFKLANDTAGHATGDAMLRAVSDVLRARMRETDHVARLGGDEFGIVLPDATEHDARAAARDIRALLCERAVGPPIMASIGIATFSGGDQVTAEEMLVCADIALFEAKERGGDIACVFSGQTSGALTWMQRIRAALNEDRLVLYEQPIIDLRSGAVTSHELLVRMVSEDGDVISPASFLPTAERFGLIGEIDRWVTAAGLRRALQGQTVSINLSGASIGEQPIIAAVRAAAAEGLDPGNVIFEITETAALRNLDAARLFSGTLTGMGCGLALDDFGTGFGSFSYLKHLPARYLKIDVDFVSGIASSETDQEIVKSIVAIARSLRKLTIAEGVEDAETLSILRDYGVDYAQGFHIGRPDRVTAPATS